MTGLINNAAADSTARVDAGGSMWRLRSLVAMGHDSTRIARALCIHTSVIQQVLRGEADAVTPELRDVACQLWDAWWDKRPPERTLGERRKARLARRRAETQGWCPPLGLDEDELDEPGYRPYSGYRPAMGTGIAGEFRPSAARHGRNASATTNSAFAEVAGSGGAGRQPRRLSSGTLGSECPSAHGPVVIDSERISDYATDNWPSDLGRAVLLSVEETTRSSGSDPDASAAFPGKLRHAGNPQVAQTPGDAVSAGQRRASGWRMYREAGP